MHNSRRMAGTKVAKLALTQCPACDEPDVPRRAASVAVESLESRMLLSASAGIIATPNIILSPSANGSAQVYGYTPAQIRNAYGFNAVTLAGGDPATGAGNTIAIVDAYNDPNIASDLATFDATFGLPSTTLTVVSQTGSMTSLPKTDASWAGEISLDVQWAHAIAPGASILLVEATSANSNDLLAAVDYARGASHVTTVSMSWGTSEFRSETNLDAYFATPAGHKGVTFVAASGDEGGNGGPEWPSSSPNVISVGGTALIIANSSGAYSSETAWSDTTGGYSRYESEPGYQNLAQDSAFRTSPDVSYDADPNTGFAVYDSVAYEGYSGWIEVGGTSAGAPQWAALIAIANQGRKDAGEAMLSGTRATSRVLYGLYNTTSAYDSSLYDVTTTQSGSYYAATTGYDGVTGLGSPRAAAIIAALINGASDFTYSQMQAAPLTINVTTRSSFQVATAIAPSEIPSDVAYAFKAESRQPFADVPLIESADLAPVSPFAQSIAVTPISASPDFVAMTDVPLPPIWQEPETTTTFFSKMNNRASSARDVDAPMRHLSPAFALEGHNVSAQQAAPIAHSAAAFSPLTDGTPRTWANILVGFLGSALVAGLHSRRSYRSRVARD